MQLSGPALGAIPGSYRAQAAHNVHARARVRLGENLGEEPE